VSSNPRLRPHTPPNIDRLNKEHLPKCLLKAGSVLFRIHRIRDREGNPLKAISYSRDNVEKNRYSRFNDPKGRSPEQSRDIYGVLYAALDQLVALRETIELTDSRLVIVETLESQCLSQLYLRRDLILVDLSGAGLARIGADARLSTITNEEYQIPQAWSRAFYEHPDNVDGIYYRSRYDPRGLCVALFDRRMAQTDFWEQRVTENNLLDPSFDNNLQKFLAQYGYERDDSENPQM
jgi:RES domain